MTWLYAMLAATLALASPTSEEFDRGKTAFGRGEYLRAIDILRPLLYPDTRLDSEADVIQAHRMLGVANLFENRPDGAKREFRKLLELRPDYRFDPMLDPPRVVEFFNGVLKEEETEIAALEAARKKRDAALAARRQREVDERCAAQSQTFTYVKHSYADQLHPVRRRPVSERSAAQGLGLPGHRGGAGRGLAGRVRDQLLGLRGQPRAPLPGSAAGHHRRAAHLHEHRPVGGDSCHAIWCACR